MTNIKPRYAQLYLISTCVFYYLAYSKLGWNIALVSTIFTSWIVLIFAFKLYKWTLTNTIKRANTKIVDILIDDEKITSIKNADLAQIKLDILHSKTLYTSQLKNSWEVLVDRFKGFMSGNAIALVVLVIAMEIFEPDMLLTLISGIRYNPHISDFTSAFFLIMFVVANLLSGFYDEPFINYFKEFTELNVRRHCGISKEGKLKFIAK